MKEDFEIIETKVPVAKDAQSAAKAIEALLNSVDEYKATKIADEYGICAYRGEYGNGETYYPKGTNAEENYIDRYAEENGIDIDENGNITEGFWVSSSEMC